MQMSNGGSTVTANNRARTANAPKPIKSSGRRPQLCANCPTDGALIATTICGRMINAEITNEAPVRLRYANRSPTSGNIEAFANWNKKRQPANISKLRFLERLNRSALGGGVDSWWSGCPHERPKWISAERTRAIARSNGNTSAAETKNIAR